MRVCNWLRAASQCSCDLPGMTNGRGDFSFGYPPPSTQCLMSPHKVHVPWSRPLLQTEGKV